MMVKVPSFAQLGLFAERSKGWVNLGRVGKGRAGDARRENSLLRGVSAAAEERQFFRWDMRVSQAELSCFQSEM